MSKISAILKSFVMTVVPAIPLYFFTYFGIFKYSYWYEEIFFPTNLLIIIVLLPLIYMSICGAMEVIKALKISLVEVGGEKDSYVIRSNGMGTYRITKISAADKKNSKFLLILFEGILLSPFVIILWLIQTVKIILSNKYCEEINQLFNNSRYNILLYCLFVVIACPSPFINDAILAGQDRVYSVANFEYSYVELSCTGKEWEGFSNESYIYDLKYNFKNTSKKAGGLRGSIVIESRNCNAKFELRDKNLTVYAPPLQQRDFEKHEVYYYFYVPISETNVNNMLQSNLNDVKIYLDVKESNWGDNKVRHYKEGEVVILKDFGALSNENPLPNPGGGAGSQETNTIETKYQNAITKYNQGDYEGAKAIFSSLGNYKQSLDYVELCEDKVFYKTMEQALVNVAGSNAILPNDYSLYTSYSENEYIYYNGSYRLGFCADLYSNSVEIEEYINSFISTLVNNGYSNIDDGTYKKGNTIIQIGYFDGDSYFTYQAFKIA